MQARTYFTVVIFLVLTALTNSVAFAITPVFINEIHYDNVSTDQGEAIEIAGPAGTDLTGWSLVLYNGSSSSLAVYDTRVLNGILLDLGNGFGVQREDYPSNGIQNGAPDAIALVDVLGNVVQFLSYEGSFTALGGPADGLTSVDIGIAESSSTAVGLSLQLNGSGSVAEDFVWSAPASHTFGAINTSQSFTGGTPQLILINELDADTAGSDTLEFVELFAAANTDLSGLVLVFYNGSSDTVYASFDLDGASTDAQGYYVLGNAAVANVDFVFPDNTLQNGADAVALYQGDAIDFPNGLSLVVSSSLLDAVVYDTGDADDIDLLVLLAAGEPQVDEDANGNKDFDAPQRCPNGSGGAGQSSVFALFAPTPGHANLCQSASTLTPIYDVQGSDVASLLVGTTVTVEGVVTGDFQDGVNGSHGDLNGFFIQDEIGDDLATSSDGIFIFDGSSPAVDVNPGDRVRVTGTVNEFFGETQISAATVTILSSGNALPVAVNVQLGANLSTRLNADGELIADLESFEGMRVSFGQSFSVAEVYNLDRFGEIRLVQGGRLFQFTNANAPDAAGFQAHLEDVARRSLMLDDGLIIQNPDPIRYPAPGLNTTNTVRIGDSVTDLIGNLRFSRGSGGRGDESYRLMPTAEPVFVATNTRPTIAPPSVGRLRVASINVLNFFNDLADGSGRCFPSNTSSDCRGASNPEEFARQLQKTSIEIGALGADIIGLVEIENDYPDAEASSIDDLVDALNAAATTTCAGGYDYVVPPGASRIGDDAIAVGLIYCTDTVSLTAGSTPAVLDDAALPALGLSGPVFNGVATNRAPLAVTFTEKASAESLTVVVNHFKSKGPSTLDDAGSTCGVDIDPATEPNCDQLDGQAFWNARRVAAATALSAWLETNPTGVNEADLLIIGDLNSYQHEDPHSLLASRGYSNLMQTLGAGDLSYTYVFDGQAGVLDYALANTSMLGQISAVGEWHINADEPDALDYNLDFGRSPAIFDSNVVYRASDHDPVMIGIDLQTSFNEIVGTRGRDTLIGSNANDRISGGPGRDRITTLAGQDILVYSSVVDGGDTITDFEVGADRIDLSVVLLSLGYSGNDALGDAYVTVISRGSSALVQVDPDGSAGAGRSRSFILLERVDAAALNNAANFIF